MALGPLRGPRPDLRSVGLRGSRLQVGKKRRAHDEGGAPGTFRAASAPPSGERGRRQKKPKEKGAEDAGRAQGETAAAEAPARAAGTEDSSHVSGRAPAVFEAGAQPDSFPGSGPSASFCHPPSEAEPRPAHSWAGGPRTCGGGSSGVAGSRQVEPQDWLRRRTVEHAKGGEPQPTPRRQRAGRGPKGEPPPAFGR